MPAADKRREAESPTVQVYLLGDFRIRVHDRVIGTSGWRRKKAQQLFKYLLTRPNRRALKDMAVDEFWPDSSPEARQIADLAKNTETEIDTTKRVAMYRRLNRMIADNGPWAPLFQPVTPYAFRSNVHGVTYASAWMVDYYTVSKT